MELSRKFAAVRRYPLVAACALALIGAAACGGAKKGEPDPVAAEGPPPAEAPAATSEPPFGDGPQSTQAPPCTRLAALCERSEPGCKTGAVNIYCDTLVNVGNDEKCANGIKRLEEQYGCTAEGSAESPDG